MKSRLLFLLPVPLPLVLRAPITDTGIPDSLMNPYPEMVWAKCKDGMPMFSAESKAS